MQDLRSLVISNFPCNRFDEKTHFLNKVTTPYSLKNASCFSIFVQRIKCHCSQYYFILSDYILYFKIVIDSVQIHLKINIKYSSIFFNQWGDENDRVPCVCVEKLVSLMFFIPYPQEANLQNFWFTDVIRYPIIHSIFFVCQQLNCKSVNVFIWQSYDFFNFLKLFYLK